MPWHELEVEQRFWSLISKSKNLLGTFMSDCFCAEAHTPGLFTLEHSVPCFYQTLAGSWWREGVQSVRKKHLSTQVEGGRLDPPEEQEMGDFSAIRKAKRNSFVG